MLEGIMLNKKSWVVVGACPEPQKYGNRIYNKLKKMGYETFAVNPNHCVVEGDTCYKDLSSLPKVPEVINMVVSPKNGKHVLEEAAGLGIKYVWFQPGSHDSATLELARQLGLLTVQSCVLLATR